MIEENESMLTIGLKLNHFLSFVEKVQIGRFRSDAQLNMSTVSAQVYRDLAVLDMFLHRVRSEEKRLKNLRIFLNQTRT